jgi:hypothetical protein
MDKLPLELIDIIYSFVPLEVKAFLTKNNYRKYHGLLREKIGKKIENYIRHTIRQDNDFVFNRILYDNYSKWFRMKNYYYKEAIYANYIYFLDSYAIDNESSKCRELIRNLFTELGLEENRHKKKTIKYIKWKT